MAMVGESGEGSSQVDPTRKRWQICMPELEAKIEKQRGSNRASSIWKVLPHLRKLDCDAYEPKLVSIGPIHHGRNDLLLMEEGKLEILRCIKGKSRDHYLDILVPKIFDFLGEARDAYAMKVDLSDDKFAEMLLVDGCFILQFIIEGIVLAQGEWGHVYLLNDLLLLENQIPFFVLEKIYQVIFKVNSENLVSLALGKLLDIKLPSENYPDAKDVRHLLHLKHLAMNPHARFNDEPRGRSCWVKTKFVLRNLYCTPLPGMYYLILFLDILGLFGAANTSEAPTMIRSATELVEAGVKFKRKATPKEYETACQLKVSFVDDTIEIPLLSVSDTTRRQLRNIIAYEQRSAKVSSRSRENSPENENQPPEHDSFYFTSYCVFLENIMNTAADVAILRESGILKNMLGSDAEAADMINGFCKELFIDYKTHYNKELFKDVEAFCKVAPNRWRANLMQKYLNSPWSIISLMAGIILLLLTALQTTYTMKQSLEKRNN